MKHLSITFYVVAMIIMVATMFRTGYDIGMNIPLVIVLTNTFVTGLFQSFFIIGLGKLMEVKK